MTFGFVRHLTLGQNKQQIKITLKKKIAPAMINCASGYSPTRKFQMQCAFHNVILPCPVYKRYFSVPQKVYDKVSPKEDDRNVYDLTKNLFTRGTDQLGTKGVVLIVRHTQITLGPQSFNTSCKQRFYRTPLSSFSSS